MWKGGHLMTKIIRKISSTGKKKFLSFSSISCTKKQNKKHISDHDSQTVATKSEIDMCTQKGLKWRPMTYITEFHLRPQGL